MFPSMRNFLKKKSIIKRTFNLSRRHIGFPLNITLRSVIAYLPKNYNHFVGKGLLYSISAFIRGIK